MRDTARPADGYRFLVLPAVGSTNSLLGRLARHGAADGTVVIARTQTAGRGRRGHEWVSPPGNLYMSVLLRPDVPASRAGQIGFVAGLAIAETLAGRVGKHSVALKWPNDVLVDDRKIAGILSEATIDGERLTEIVLGIGVNLAHAPESGLRWPAVALAEVAAPADPIAFAAALTRRLVRWLDIWLDGGFEPVRAAWLGRAWGLGRDFSTHDATGSVSGRFDGIDADGALVLASVGGGQRRVRSGEVHPGEVHPSEGSLMLLAIDSGNTNAVFAVFDGGVRRGEWRSARMSGKTADEYAVWLTQLMAMDGLDPKAIDAAIIANVVPAASYDLTSLCKRYFSTTPMVVGEPSIKLGIEVLVPNPEEVGADRLVNAVGASESYKGPLIIIDFGTATTFDVIDENGAYRGGVIAPGINLSMEALHAAAAKLPRVAITQPAKIIGTSTVGAMQTGIFWGYVGLIEGLVDRISKEYGREMTVVATGGLAPLFNDVTDAIDHLDRDLTLRGLLAIYNRNIRK